VTPVASPAVSSSPAPLAIDGLTLAEHTITSGEVFHGTFAIKQPGTQTITGYGLSIPDGTKTYTLQYTLPVVAGGSASMELGPLPPVKKAGPTTFEFWLIDSAGTQSNHLTGSLTLQ
jgi:hypothetical protein